MKKIFNSLTESNYKLLIILLVPSLFLTKTLEMALISSLLLFTTILIISVIMQMFKNKKGAIYFYINIIITAIIVSMMLFLINLISVDLFHVLKIYFPIMMMSYPLVEVNEKNKIKNNVTVSTWGSILIIILGFIRELFGNNTLTFLNLLTPLTGYKAIYQIFPENNILPVEILLNPAGGFILLGLIFWIINYIKGGNN